MENLEKDKKKRSLFRRNVTKLVNKVKDILDSPDVEDGLVEHLRKELLERQIELKEVDDKILDSLLEIEETDEQELDRESEEASSYKEKISFAISRIDRFLKPPERNSHNMRSLSQDSLNSNSSSETKLVKKVNIKLPKLELKKFGGKIHEWPEFWDGFQSVHGNPDLADCDKFKYLKSFLEEPARRVVAGMPMTEENYKIAVDLLQKRFGRKEVIQQAHIGHLMGLQPVFNEKSTTRLRNLHDEIETHFRGLEAMGVNKYSYSSIVVPCLMEKIPENMRSQMIRNSRENYLSWAVDDLLAYMEQELHIKECQVPFAKKENAEFGARPRLDRGHGGTASSLHVGSKTEEGSCVFCRKGHAPEACNNVKGAERRRNMLMRYAKCFLCLRSGHRAYNCRSNLNCSTCKGRHNVAICSKAEKVQFDKLNRSDKETEGNRSSAAQLSPNAPSWIGSTGSGGNVALQTAAAKVNGHRLRVLFDSGSHRSFITSQTVSKLGLEIIREETLGIKPFGSESAEYKVREVVRVPLSSQDGMRKIVIECFVVDNISKISNVHPEVVRKSYPHLHEIWFSDVCRLETLTVEILVGSDFMWSFMEGEIKRGGPGEPVGVKTALGWVLSGPLEGNKLISYEFNVNFVPEETSTLFVRQDLDLHNKIDKLWNLDSIGIKEENNVYEMVLDNLTFDGKRYSVGLPWKTGHKTLPTNFDNAYGRLNSLVNKLKKNPSHFKKYDDIIREQVEQGIVEQVTDLELAAETHYLPHMAVIREEAETTKVRIVFDASSKDKKQGTSLNDCLHVGPSLTPLIFDILLRFRENKVALVGDIEKAFLSIEVDAADRDFLRFLWLNDIESENPKVCVFRFKRVIFGANSSPFLLNAVLRHHINQYKEIDPQFVVKLIEGFFVDDLVTGGNSKEDAKSLFNKAKERMLEGGFRLRKWKTNDDDLAQEILKDEGAVVVRSATDDITYAKETLGGVSTDVKKTKVLGVIWDNKNDKLELNFSRIDKKAIPLTKRSMLSTLAAIFDPHGIVSPIVVTAKILFQEACMLKLGWDDPLPESLVGKWTSWVKDLNAVGNITLPRCLYDKSEGEIRNVELHGFGDASCKGYCAVVYLTYETDPGINTILLCSKSRVAPLKELSIPRLELLSARILATLVDSVRKALASQVKIDTVKLWLDSKTALSWIHHKGEWKQWVQFRVSEILKVTQIEDWGYVRGTENPADIGSRGTSASQLKENKLWWEGPTWLRKGRTEWPGGIELEDTEEVNKEKKKTSVLITVAEQPKGIGKVVDINRYSSLRKLLRVTAFIYRFISNLKAKLNKQPVNQSPLDPEEIVQAEKKWIKDAQLLIKEEKSYDRIKLQLGVQEVDELLICKGRLDNSELKLESKHPIILPKEHHLTELVVRDCHKAVFHGLVRATLAEVRTRFWISKGRQFVKKILKSCSICRKLEGKAYGAPPTAQLPEFRVTMTKPFANVGIDFAGPLYIKASNSEMTKVYICLFSCCVTRALHLELVQDLSASVFLNCLRRFCAKRGTPEVINSDNAKTFKATAKFLKKLSNNQEIKTFLEIKRIKWKFNLEVSPWQGGHFERMVRSVKRCLRKVLGNAKVSHDELCTLLAEVECVLNNRPLTYLYDELGGEVLTPSHLVMGRRLNLLSSGIEYRNKNKENQSSLTKRFLHLTRLLNHFWNRWKKEYLVNLRESHKMVSNKQQVIRTGDIVLVQDDNLKRGEWKVAKVEELIAGKDGHVRGAKVRRVGKGKYEILNRPIQKLYPFVDAGEEVKESKKEGNAVEGRSENEQQDQSQAHQATGTRATRAAARDARLKTKLLLDS